MNDDTAVLRPVAGEPVDDGRAGLAAELAAAAPRRWWNRGTLVLGVLALVLAGFLGGLQVQKHFGAVAPTAAARPAGFPGGGGFGGPGRAGTASEPPGGATPAAAGTNGTVKLVDGTTIYVQTPDGSVVTVRTSDSTDVRTATEGAVSDVRAGDSVTVQGPAGADGTVTATTVTRTKK
jgi:hypothetical protein